jgi:hypothetical protein
MAAYEYTLKVGVQAASSTTLRTTKPVTERVTIVDLYDGQRYRVQAVYKAREGEREWNTMPETVVQLWHSGHVNGAELARLREREHYIANEQFGPFDCVVFVAPL